MSFQFKFPDVGEGVHEGKVLQLKFKVGDIVQEGDIIAVVETDKVVADIPSPITGKLISYSIEEGQIIEVGKTLATFGKNDSAVDLTPAKTVAISESEEAGVVGQLESDKSGMVLPATGEGISDKSEEHVSLSSSHPKATPLARRLAARTGIDLTKIVGTGPQGRITKADLENLGQNDEPQSSKKEEPLVSSGALIELSTMRKSIAKNMESAQTIPAVTITEELSISKLSALREQLNVGRVERISFQPFFMKAIALALKEFPLFNGTYLKEKESFIQSNEINIGFAVDTNKGLLVPTVKNVQSSSIIKINKEMKDLAAKAKESKITMQDIKGGTISISNYGAFAGLFATPMILAPQVAIVGFGRIHEKPVVQNHQVVIDLVLPLSFTFDHRIADGVYASRFIARLKELLAEPALMLTLLS